MAITFDEYEIDLFCPECDEEFMVLGKQLARSADVPCPACSATFRVDVWAFHAQWARMRKLLGGL